MIRQQYFRSKHCESLIRNPYQQAINQNFSFDVYDGFHSIRIKHPSFADDDRPRRSLAGNLWFSYHSPPLHTRSSWMARIPRMDLPVCFLFTSDHRWSYGSDQWLGKLIHSHHFQHGIVATSSCHGGNTPRSVGTSYSIVSTCADHRAVVVTTVLQSSAIRSNGFLSLSSISSSQPAWHWSLRVPLLLEPKMGRIRRTISSSRLV